MRRLLSALGRAALVLAFAGTWGSACRIGYEPTSGSAGGIGGFAGDPLLAGSSQGATSSTGQAGSGLAGASDSGDGVGGGGAIGGSSGAGGSSGGAPGGGAGSGGSSGGAPGGGGGAGGSSGGAAGGRAGAGGSSGGAPGGGAGAGGSGGGASIDCSSIVAPSLPAMLPPIAGVGCTVDNVSLNGGGNVIQIAPGAPLAVSLAWQVTESRCGTCIDQLEIAVTPGNNVLFCAFSTQPRKGRIDGSGTFNTKAPSVPGIYNLTFGIGQALVCSEVSDGCGIGANPACGKQWPGSNWDVSMGVLCVK